LCLSCNVKKSENLSDLNKKERNKRHFSPFITFVKGVFFVVRATLVPVSYLSAPSAVHSYRLPGKFISSLKSFFVCWNFYSFSTNKAKIYSYSIFVQQMYWLQDKYIFVYVQCPIMAPVNTIYPIEIMHTCLMRQYRGFSNQPTAPKEIYFCWYILRKQDYINLIDTYIKMHPPIIEVTRCHMLKW
jgi:hypothetical protein